MPRTKERVKSELALHDFLIDCQDTEEGGERMFKMACEIVKRLNKDQLSRLDSRIWVAMMEKEEL